MKASFNNSVLGKSKISSTNRSLLYGSQDKKVYDSKLADMNFDLLKVSKKIEKQNNFQEHIQSLIEEEIFLRQEIEKKTFLINENLTSEINKLKNDFKTFTSEIGNSLQKNKDQLNENFIENNSKIMSQTEENIKRLNEFQQKINNYIQNKEMKNQEIEDKLKILEDVSTNQIQIIKKNLQENSKEILLMREQLGNNTSYLNNEMKNIRNEIINIKNEVQILKSTKVSLYSDMDKILKQLDVVNQRFDSTIKEIQNNSIEVKTKLNNYETTNRLFQQNFNTIKDDFLHHLDDINNLKQDELNKITENVFGQIKQLKSDMDKFNLNIIQENQKFIDFSQNQLQEHDANMKKLFEFTSDDIEILKKKSDSLENLMKNTRNEMISNINSVEGFLTNRYDSLFKSVASERNINNPF